ncbi:DUF6900 domain-containing protein [Cerasicoccus maritimus]|uniref:DUF6900 domain-containing protein n=1 Tax=Cerasicoccus maritimus TaxID=490089 RepID=UPI0028528AAA|nr:hypothetical protein [Cerasicoccus maritimus]
MDDIFEDIAQNCFGIETLESRKMDALDFPTCSVWDLREGLEAAYRKGLEDQVVVLGAGTMFGFKRNAVIRALSTSHRMATATIAAAMQSFGLQYEAEDLRRIASHDGYRATLTGEQHFLLCERAELYSRVK